MPIIPLINLKLDFMMTAHSKIRESFLKSFLGFLTVKANSHKCKVL